MNKESVFLRGSAPAEEAMMSVEMMTKDLEHSINLVAKAGAGFERIDSDLESSPLGKVVSASDQCYKEISPERKSPLMQQTSVCLV